ncbi:MAG TPA: PIN domain-containing protein [Halococcus sp.]|nr:PIN domain-containing protein [Halococcus sp.]
MSSRRVLPDLNALSIQLVDDHPGHPYVANELVPALSGEESLLVFGYLPLRVQWVIEDLGFETVDARNAVSSLLQDPMEFVHIDGETTLRAYDISAEKNHDVYDCFYVALARETEADALVTTDRDFERLCENEDFEYVNPVPEDVLERFHEIDT